MLNKHMLLLLIAVLMLFAPTAHCGPVAGAACFVALAVACGAAHVFWVPCYAAGIPACELALIAPSP